MILEIEKRKEMESFTLLFFKKSPIALSGRRESFEKKGVDPQELNPGTRVLIKGKYGDEEEAFEKVDSLEEIRLVK